MDIILEAKHLYKIYNMGEVEVHAVDGIDLCIERGRFYAIVGKSGSGKSTLLHLLSGLDRPTKGRVLIDKMDISKMKDAELSMMRRRKIVFVWQSYQLLQEFCVEENIKMPLYLEEKKEDSRYIRYIMEKLEIIDLRLKFPSQLSGGEQQRTAIARALVAKPDIIFADEPTGNLDQKTGREVLKVFRNIQRMLGQTILLVTHDMEIAQLADEIIHMEDGVVL